MSISLDPTIAATVGFELLDDLLARDVETTLAAALKAEVELPVGTTPLEVFRDTVRTAVGRIHEDGRAPLFLRFLKDGPYEDGGEIPAELRDKRLTDDETAAVTGFIHSHMVNCFKGALMESLAIGPVLRLLRDLKRAKRLPKEVWLLVGDTVWSRAVARGEFKKGADMHLLVPPPAKSTIPSVAVAGVVEVKSYFKTAQSLRPQLAQHLKRAKRGLRIAGVEYTPAQVLFVGEDRKPVRISVVPSAWSLPRGFRFEHKDGRKFLQVDPPVPPDLEAKIEPAGPRSWHITLRWSKEALDAAAYGLTFWFMEKVGEALYAGGVPPEWSEMPPAQAGQNAAKQALYYAINRARNRRDEQHAIALYNSYGFGCALGMNFRNAAGHREMLWPEDLDEILANGHNKNGCRIW